MKCCIDNDNGGMVKDSAMNGCSWYNDKLDQCGDFNTDDFVAELMCCVCSPTGPPCDCDVSDTDNCCCPNPTTDICKVPACLTNEYYGEDYFENNC